MSTHFSYFYGTYPYFITYLQFFSHFPYSTANYCQNSLNILILLHLSHYPVNFLCRDSNNFLRLAAFSCLLSYNMLDLFVILQIVIYFCHLPYFAEAPVFLLVVKISYRTPYSATHVTLTTMYLIHFYLNFYLFLTNPDSFT